VFHVGYKIQIFKNIFSTPTEMRKPCRLDLCWKETTTVKNRLYIDYMFMSTLQYVGYEKFPLMYLFPQPLQTLGFCLKRKSRSIYRPPLDPFSEMIRNTTIYISYLHPTIHIRKWPNPTKVLPTISGYDQKYYRPCLEMTRNADVHIC